MGTGSHSRVKSYATVALVAPFVMNSGCLWFLSHLGSYGFELYLGTMALSIGVGAVGLVAALRHRGWRPPAWGAATLAYCIAAYVVLTLFGVFFAVLVLGGGKR